ncbi:unnamed protein product [Peronospora destructor]|uniref:Uncharacterized protein n=1 Tax=Peronospora destructor TaxID=86335 RepID=A0AAV0U3L3_9STRA|nr:unnamed protein product [Peronospora destructor]
MFSAAQVVTNVPLLEPSLPVFSTPLKMSIFPQTKSRLEKKLRTLITKLQEQSDKDQEGDTRPLLALQLKEAVAELLRCWIADPVEGFVLRKEHVINGMRLDDLVTTPAGSGYLRGYRREDGFCTVLYPWGQGFVQVNDVKKVQQTLGKHLKKRTYNEYVAFEHQQLYKQIEELLDNLPSPTPKERGLVKKEASVAAEDKREDDMKESKELVKSLKDEHVDTTVLRKDLGFLKRVQALANKAKELRHSHIRQKPEQKLLRMDKDHELSPPADQEGFGTSIQSPAHIVEQQQQEQEEQEQEELEQEEQEQELTKKEKGTAVDEKAETGSEKK